MSKDVALVIGDCHGMFDSLEDVVYYAGILAVSNNYTIRKIIQVGDFGYYPKLPDHYDNQVQEPRILKDVPRYWIRGNHEDHEFLERVYHDPGPVLLPKAGVWQYMPDCLIHEGILYIGGAWSIDKRYRDRPDHPYRWNYNEQIDDAHVDKLYAIMEEPDLLNTVKVVITHDHPLCLYEKVVGQLLPYADYKTPRLFDSLVNRINRYCDHRVVWCAGHLGKSHMRPSSPRYGTPLKFDLGLVDFYSLDMICGFDQVSKEADAFTFVEL